VQLAGEFKTDPVSLFHDRVWVSPFFEDDVVALVKLVGADRVLFGSDFPHVEGLSDPMSFEKELVGIPRADIRKIMYENANGLATRQAG